MSNETETIDIANGITGDVRALLYAQAFQNYLVEKLGKTEDEARKEAMLYSFEYVMRAILGRSIQ